MELTEEGARNIARLVLGHVARPFPYKDDHVFTGTADLRLPQSAHPAFFGSFDWHSCVHGWWTLLTLRRLFSASAEAAEIARLADATFTDTKLAAELAYLARPSARGFERPYGWGWLMYLHHEAARHGDRAWGERLEPLARAFATRFRDYLGILTYPITVGTHFNTAFALVLARRWAVSRDADLVVLIDDWAERSFGHRRDYAGWEPSGDEFLSPVLTAALLMAEVRPPRTFRAWFTALVVENGWLAHQCRPVFVSDRSDGKIAHLDGLNLSRAWCLTTIAEALETDVERAILLQRAEEHLAAALPHVAGDYMGEHWLASFALLALVTRS